MIKELLLGANYAVRGCRAFCNDRNAWKYAVLPFLILFLFYLGIFWGFFALTGKAAAAFQDVSLPAYLEWLHTLISGLSGILAILAGALFLFVTFCSFYEITGELFFDALLEYYEKKTFGHSPCPMPLKVQLKQTLSALKGGMKTLLLSLILFIPSLLFPVIGQLLFIVIIGSRMGWTYIVNPAFNSGLVFAQARKLAAKRETVVSGFGITACALQFFPFINIFLLPGLVLGGSELFHNELKEKK